MTERLFPTLKKLSMFTKLLLVLAAGFLTWRGILDLENLPLHSWKWRMIADALLATQVLLWTFFTLVLLAPGWRRSLNIRNPLPRTITGLAVAVILFLPVALYLMTGWGRYFSGAFLRFHIHLLSGLLLSVLLFSPENRYPFGMLVGLGISAFLYACLVNLQTVNGYPFSIGWSEGNRFYDYSLSFAKNLYQYQGVLKLPYDSPGRYALWGAAFLVPGLPIWVHRLWNALLWICTPLLLSVVLFRPIRAAAARWALVLWGTLFIMQGPVYPHLLVPMILLAALLRIRSPWVRIVAGALISYYAGISRFTWGVLPGIWLVLDDLLTRYPERQGTWWRRLIPTAALGLAGILPGMAQQSWLAIFQPGGSLTTAQPLLFDRLWPNSTNPDGILFGAILTTLPLILILVWLTLRKYWEIHPLAQAALWTALAGLIAVGLVASVKIGGGSNLHNLDMALLTLVFLVSQAAHQLKFGGLRGRTAPSWVLLLVCLAVLVPGFYTIRTAVKRFPYDPVRSEQALELIRQYVAAASPKGEVLFIDQRQLLTFGYVRGVALVPDYEKKYLMDQAMAGNADYFSGFVRDLGNARFSLIIADNQKLDLQDERRPFSQENNAYVRWVSVPILDYYQPVEYLQEYGLMILVPKTR